MSAEPKLTEQVRAALAAVPYARFLGVEVVFNGDEMTAVLPFADHLIGNPVLPAIHGGVLGAFMELTAIAQLSALAPLSRRPRTIDVSIDYLRSGRPLTTYARAEVKKVGRRSPTCTSRPGRSSGWRPSPRCARTSWSIRKPERPYRLNADSPRI